MLDVSSENLPWRSGATRETVVSRSVFHTLTYADVFDYPLTASEVYRYLTSAKATLAEVTRALSDSSLFSQVEGYFTLRGREEIVKTREQRSKVAARLWPKALRYGHMIARLPFVRMVAITGSLSMENSDEGKDVDYMIVTAPDHLWTCRGLSLLVTRLAKREGIRLCPNYLVTTNALKLTERSLYVAHELAQMIPLSGMEIYDEMLHLNDWIYEYLPNASGMPAWPRTVEQIMGGSMIQKSLELLLSLPFGTWLEKWEMNRKIQRLTYEQSSSSESYFSANVCKGHIDQHGENTVMALTVRLNTRASHQIHERISLEQKPVRLDETH
jgi:hypothetical protein